jgi:hypothetical protein
MRYDGEIMAKLLTESRTGGLTKNPDGTYNVVLISPGRGSSGYYSEELLREYGAVAFPAGTHSYLDHLGENENRSASKLLGVYPEAAHYEEGVGLVSKFRPMKHWADFVEEVAPYTGLSIYAQGEGVEEDMDGESVYVVKELLPNIMNTVDLVSYAGRGGHFVESLIESALANKETENNNMALEDEVRNLVAVITPLVSELSTAREELKQAKEAADASAVDATEASAKAVEAAREVETAELPEKVKESLRAQIDAGNYNVKPAIESAVAIREAVLAEAKVEEKDPLAGFLGESYIGTTTSTSNEITVGGWN